MFFGTLPFFFLCGIPPSMARWTEMPMPIYQRILFAAAALVGLYIFAIAETQIQFWWGSHNGDITCDEGRHPAESVAWYIPTIVPIYTCER